jgi:hypothetical protein
LVHSIFAFKKFIKNAASHNNSFPVFQGKTTIVQNDSWTYCALVPATIVGNELVNGSQFGLGPENDMMTMYNTAFSMSQEEYRILTVCIYEVGKMQN